MSDKIYESGEDYLETILRLSNRQGKVKSIDIANEMEYSKPSVSQAMKILQEKGYVFMDERKYIHLTMEGKERAERIYQRHLLIKGALEELLGVSPRVAEKDACRIEHVLSEETVSRLEVLMHEKFGLTETK